MKLGFLVRKFACYTSLIGWLMQVGYAAGWRIFRKRAWQPMMGSGAVVASTSALEEWERLVEKKQDDLEMEMEEPHPLRTQEWRLEIRVSPWQRRDQDVTFHRNGTMWTTEGERGDWWFDVGGLYWDVNTTIRDMPTVLHHKAELHWNIFGEQPRMFRGTVTRDRLPQSFLPPWLFRPVIGSFVGSGVGNDTADTSYRHRHGMPLGEDGSMPPRVAPQTDRY